MLATGGAGGVPAGRLAIAPNGAVAVALFDQSTVNPTSGKIVGLRLSQSGDGGSESGAVGFDGFQARDRGGDGTGCLARHHIVGEHTGMAQLVIRLVTPAA